MKICSEQKKTTTRFERITINKKLLVESVLTLLFLAGCATTDYSQNVKDWQQMIRSMQITAVFPPREGIQPGGIYSDDYRTSDDEIKVMKSNNFVAEPTLWVQMDVNEDLKNYQNLLYDFPATSAVPDTVTKAASGVPAANNTDSSILDQRITHRLPMVSFPDFSYMTVNSDSLPAVFSLHGLPGLLNLNHADLATVSIKINNAEYYGLPAVTIINKFKKISQSDLAYIYDGSPKDSKKIATARLITEVYQTRNLQITATYKNENNANGGLGNTANSNISGASSSVLPTLPQAASGVSALNTLQDYNVQLNNASSLFSKGFRFQIDSYSERGISVNKIFDKPIVLGVRFIRVYLNKDNKNQINVSYSLSSCANSECPEPNGGSNNEQLSAVTLPGNVSGGNLLSEKINIKK